MNIDEIVEKARDSISDYCLNECKAYCCRKSHFLIINKIQIKTFTNNKINYFIEKRIIKKLKDGKFSFDLRKNNNLCPNLNLENFKCKIYNNKNKPDVCNEFPLFINKKKKQFRFASGCPAVKNNKFYPYISLLLKQGYKLE